MDWIILSFVSEILFEYIDGELIGLSVSDMKLADLAQANETGAVVVGRNENSNEWFEVKDFADKGAEIFLPEKLVEA